MDLILAVFPIPAEAGAAMRARIAAGRRPFAPAPASAAGRMGERPDPDQSHSGRRRGAIAPLVVFSLAFGFAATRIAADARTRLLDGLDAVLQTLLTLVAWVLKAGPLGVAALAFVAAAQAGLGAAGALIHYVGVSSCSAWWWSPRSIPGRAGRRPVARALRQGCGSAQAVAFSTQSSIATLPALLDSARGPGRPAVRGQGRAAAGGVAVPGGQRERPAGPSPSVSPGCRA